MTPEENTRDARDTRNTQNAREPEKPQESGQPADHSDTPKPPEEHQEQARKIETPPESQEAPEENNQEMISFTREQVEKMEQSAKDLDQAQKQIESMKDQYLRLAAEYDNYRKRTAREKDALYQDAKADTIREFLAVYDNLERAANTEGDDDSPHKQGLIKIFQQCREILKKLGLKEIDALGQVFDPEKHNAVMHIEDENLGENVISQVFQDGFTLGDKVIRHATVQVAN